MSLNKGLKKANRAHGIFSRVIAELEDAADHLIGSGAAHRALAQEHEALANVANEEAARALATATRVRELVQG